MELRYRESPMPRLMLDPQRIRQIVFNLVGNALKFTERGYVELRASYSRAAGANTGTFRIEVEDTGCGIREDDLKHLGSAYVQVDSHLARHGGTGLGLAICKQLAIAMGGKLKVESTLGSGSTFSIVVPGVSVAATACAAQSEAPKAPAPAAGHADWPRRLLIVDDSKINLMVMKAHLKKLGEFDVVAASDGKEALDILTDPATVPFDLVMTDMWMPNLDGEGLVRAIRQTPSLATLPVLAVTADVEARDKAAKMGFNGILLKPVTIDALVKAISGCSTGP